MSIRDPQITFPGCITQVPQSTPRDTYKHLQTAATNIGNLQTGKLGNSGQLTLSGSLTISEALTVSGSLSISSLIVRGAATVSGTLLLASGLQGWGDSIFYGGLTVQGSTNLAGLTAGPTTLSSLTVTGAVSLPNLIIASLLLSSLQVTGSTNLNGLVAGASTLNSLTVTGSVYLPAGAALGGSTCNSLVVSGATNLNGLVAGPTTLNSATVTGNLITNGLFTAGASTVNSLTVTGATTLNGALSATGIVTCTVVDTATGSVACALQIGHTLAANSPAWQSGFGTSMQIWGCDSANTFREYAEIKSFPNVGTPGSFGTCLSFSTYENAVLTEQLRIRNNQTAFFTDVQIGGNVGFFGTTPIGQPAGTTDLLTGIVNLGLRASGTNVPLSLGGGALTAGASTLNSLVVTGSTNLNALVAGSSTLNSLTVTGTTIHQGAVNANGLIAGVTTLNSLTVTGATTLQAALTASGQITGAGQLQIWGLANLLNNLTVSGSVGIQNGLSVYAGLTVYGHANSGGAAPTAASGAAAGTAQCPAPVVTAGANDTRGNITFGSGTAPTSGSVLVVTFSQAYTSTPVVDVVPRNTATASISPLIISSVSTTNFTVSATHPPVASQGNTVYNLDYMVRG